MIAAIIGSIGVGLLLLAFFLNLFKILDQKKKPYVIMNIFGGSSRLFFHSNRILAICYS